MTIEILDIVPENPKKQHVSQYMGDARVDEHARQQWQECNLEGDSTVNPPRKAGRYRGIRIHEKFKRWGGKCELIEEHDEIEGDEPGVYEGIAAARIEILERDKHT